MYRIGVLTGTRAEYGLLKPLMEKINNDPGLELYLIVTGAHLEERLGNTCEQIERDALPIGAKIPMGLAEDTPQGICVSIGRELAGLSETFRDAALDLLVLLGDRYEALAAAVAAVLFRIPVAHIHGGETTEGAIDDMMRHAITKLSQLHFASTTKYAERIIRMGEQPGQVHAVGALGVENIKTMNLLRRETLATQFGSLFLKPYVMVTYHPVTLDDESAEQQIEALFAALEKHPEYNYIFTYANADRGGAAINEMLESFANEHANAAVFSSMGQVGYLSALHYASAVVGNSSSGIIEAPSFHIPTVDIGRRQRGRMAGDSVLHCGNGCGEICAALDAALSEEFRQKCRAARNPYEGSGTSMAIVMEIKKALEQGICMQKKFYDGV